MWYTWRSPPCLYTFPGGMWWAAHTHQYLMGNNVDEWDSKCRTGLTSAAKNQRLEARTKTKRMHLFSTGRMKKTHVAACRSSSGGAMETYLHRAHHHMIPCTLRGSSHRYTSPLSLDRSHWHTYPKTGTHRYLRKTHAGLHEYRYKNIIKCGGLRFHNTGILMMSWLLDALIFFYWVVSSDGIYLHISGGQERPCSQPYIGYSCRSLRCWRTPRQGRSSPEHTHPHLEAEISIKHGEVNQNLDLVHIGQTFASLSVSRRSKSKLAVLTNVGTRGVDTHASKARVTERTLVDI